jgi:LmbE family N-acetylglucosaminyl deacetylase
VNSYPDADVSNLYEDLRDEPEKLPVPASALAVGAHPDDAEFGAGATLARWADSGTAVALLVVTDGSKGSWDRDADPAALAERRRHEQNEAAAVLGARSTIVLNYVDGELEYTMDLRAELCYWVRRLQPEVVLTHDPWQHYQLHPDHRITGLSTLDAVAAARDPLFFPAQLSDAEPHRPAAVLLWSADEPNHWEDAAGWVEHKITALLCHSSQSATTLGNADADPESAAAFAERVRAWAARSGEPAGLTAAEAFRRITP